MMPTGYFNTYNITDGAIETLRGLIIVLSDVLRESNAINHMDHDTSPISSLMEVIEEKARALPALHNQEWETIKAIHIKAAGA